MKTKRLISYNVHKGLDPFGRAIGIAPIKQALKELSPDFLLVQELAEKKKTKENQLEELADKTWPHHSYGKNAVYPSGNHGNAILSSYPIAKSVNHNLTVHSLEKRGLLHVTLDLDRPLHLLNTHLDLLEFTRSRQIKTIVDILHDIPKNQAIIFGGDFNDWAEKAAISLSSLDLVEHSKASFPSILPFLALDRIYTRHISVHNFQVCKGAPWNRLSDHLPLALDFTWNFSR